DPVIGRNAENPAMLLDHIEQTLLALFRAVRAANQSGFEDFRGPAGALGAGAGRKMRGFRPRSRLCHVAILPDRSAPLGGRVPPPIYPEPDNRAMVQFVAG